ncbi:hypothetical protein H5410_032077 [Solanum commersonii]|uniref:Uncharacterized protein n=1 Tax=Solanum commersonii TaxID=4109 RepID=A0A9J5YIY5_SOLCO|nr:hypothetical protein H5410_032077 [Solanum commersonii]
MEEIQEIMQQINVQIWHVFQYFHQLPSLGSKQGKYTAIATFSIFSYNIEATGFHSYTIYKVNSIYFWSKNTAQELLLSYDSQQKMIQGPTKVKKAREQIDLLLSDFNWKTQGIRNTNRVENDKEFEKSVHRSAKLKNKAFILCQPRHEPYWRVHLQERRIQLKRRDGDRIREGNTNFLEAEDLHNMMIMKEVEHPQMKSQKLMNSIELIFKQWTERVK